MPAIRRLRQPPPSTTARQANELSLKLRWQTTFQPAATVPFSPRREHRCSGAGVGGGLRVGRLVRLGSILVGIILIVGFADTGGKAETADATDALGDTEDTLGATKDTLGATEDTLDATEDALDATEIAVGATGIAVGATEMMAGAAGTRAGATGATGITAGTTGLTGIIEVTSGATGVCSEAGTDCVVRAALPRVKGSADRAARSGTDSFRALEPMVITAPTSTPTVMLSVAAVRVVPIRRCIAPASLPVEVVVLEVAIVPGTLTHGYRSAVPRRSHRPDRAHRRVATDRWDEDSAQPAAGWQTARSTADGDFLVRTVPGPATRKTYRCPGCQQSIGPGTAHLVVWPAWTGHEDGVEHRRHWHTGCWNRRAERGGPGALPR